MIDCIARCSPPALRMRAPSLIPAMGTPLKLDFDDTIINRRHHNKPLTRQVETPGTPLESMK